MTSNSDASDVDTPELRLTPSNIKSSAQILLEKLRTFTFANVDVDNNHSVNREELSDFFLANGISQEITDVVFDSIDANGDQSISPIEYFRWLDRLNIRRVREMLRELNVYLSLSFSCVTHNTTRTHRFGRSNAVEVNLK